MDKKVYETPTVSLDTSTGGATPMSLVIAAAVAVVAVAGGIWDAGVVINVGAWFNAAAFVNAVTS